MQIIKKYWWRLTNFKRYRKLHKLLNTPSPWPEPKIDIQDFVESMQPLLDKIGSDYDEDGIPYWEKWDN